ncbi:MAG TPA: LamG-like jellyroll fold domain-containing protein [Rhizomicrobium sp.]|nr:LamG-like jellyroll fold domain-containing protein [Rhizomicrobium sp.]
MRFGSGVLRAAALAACLFGVGAAAAPAGDSGLLFHLSFDKDLTADTARGVAAPNIADRVKVVPGGHAGAYLQLADDGVVSWHAAGNIFAQRGTLAFFWRARTPLGSGQFPIFRVGYGDHTSWDMTWLRIDYNGHGFDAMVTDASLARVRVSYALPVLPKPDEWLHLALAWDETRGIRFYVNGVLAGRTDGAGIYDTALDQFGPHSRTIGPMQVQTAYQYMRGGDVDELSIYDHMLADASIAALAAGNDVAGDPAPLRDLADPKWRAEWWLRYGWTAAPPAYLAAPSTWIRKVEFTDARDLEERMVGGSDGIAETTWPGVYNRSRIPGRHDYFELPDWNVYVEGGKAITFTLPNEPWNHLEFQGTANGTLTFLPASGAEHLLAARPAGLERSVHDFATLTGGRLRFDNAVQESPIQELAAYDVAPGAPPAGETALSYTIRAAAAPHDYPTLDSLIAFVKGRFVADERATVVALPDGAPAAAPRAAETAPSLPIVHVLIPADLRTPRAGLAQSHYGYGWQLIDGGLDGIAIDLPALNVKPTHGALLPLNIQVKDPIWPARNLMDISVSVKPGEARTLWLDTRDRLLPPDTSLYLTIAAAGGGFSAASLDGTRIRLIFKPRDKALPEHVADRLAQMRDNFAYFVEEHTSTRILARFERFYREITDLLRADPGNVTAHRYWAEVAPEAGWPPVVLPPVPKGVPLWAARQVQDLKLVRQFIDWWIDHRQVAYGDFGGGISDDDDLTEQWPPLALMGDDADKIKRSLDLLTDAVDRNGMITGGLGTILTDQLHSYEEGINARSEDAYLADGDPKAIERLMDTARGYARIAGPVGGHTHMLSSLFSGTRVVREGPWAWSKPYSYLILHPGILLAEYNGNPGIRKLIVALADSYLAHATKNDKGETVFPEDINSLSDEARGTLTAGSNGVVGPIELMWTAWRWTNDAKYLAPIESVVGKGDHGALSLLNANAVELLNKQASWGRDIAKAANAGKGVDARDNGARPVDFNRFIAWQMTGNKQYLADLYTSEITTDLDRMSMVTEDEWWTDRVELFSDLLQRSRLGGMALRRNQIYPGHLVSWRFAGAPTAAENVALLIRDASPTHFRVIAYNLTNAALAATMTGQNIDAGSWTMTSGLDANDDDKPDGAVQGKTVVFERGAGLALVFPPHKTLVIELTLKTPTPPVSARPDIGIGPADVHAAGGGLDVTLHSLGAVATPAGTLTLNSAAGRPVASVAVPPLEPPLDLVPRTVTVHLAIPPRTVLAKAHLAVALAGNPPEITLANNGITLP